MVQRDAIMWKIVSVFLVMIALIIAGIVDYDGDGSTLSTHPTTLTAPNAEIRTWWDLDAVRHNLTRNCTLMNPLDSTIAG